MRIRRKKCLPIEMNIKLIFILTISILIVKIVSYGNLFFMITSDLLAFLLLTTKNV